MSDLWHWLTSAVDDAGNTIDDVAKDAGVAGEDIGEWLKQAIVGVPSTVESVFDPALPPDMKKAIEEKEAKKKKPEETEAEKKKGDEEAAAAKEAAVKQLEEQNAAAQTWNTYGEAITKDQQNLVQPVEEAISGALTKPAESSAASDAMAAIGLSPDSSAAKWLQSQISQANAIDTPMAQAMAAYGAAYETGQKGVDEALSAMGGANALDVQTAPEADWIQALASHITGNINYYGEITPALAASLPPALQWALQQSGAGGQAAAGTESVSSLKPAGASTLAPENPGTASTTNPLGNIMKAATAGANGGGVIPSDYGSAP